MNPSAKPNSAESPSQIGRLIVEYDHASGSFRWVQEGKPIPAHALNNVLDLLKFECVSQQMVALAQAAKMQAQKGILVPNGAPLPNLRG